MIIIIYYADVQAVPKTIPDRLSLRACIKIAGSANPLKGAFGTHHGMSGHKAKFRVGEIIHHQLFDYLGVVFDVDPVFSGTDEWYDQVARSRPPKDASWYHVLVDQASHTTYVAEQYLESADQPQPIRHVLLDHHFSGFDGARYILRQRVN